MARRRVRLALRRARLAKGLTQGQVADALDWSLSKVQRIESGEVAVSSTDLRAALNLLGITNPDQVDRLAGEARASRRRSWWDQAHYRNVLTAATLQLLQFESTATAIRSFQLTLIPGLLQTSDYAAAVVNFWEEELSSGDRSARVELRMQRPKHVFERPDPAHYYVILDESVVLREVGGPAIMAAQLQHLLDMIKAGRVTIRVVPLAVAAPIAILGPFTIIDLDEEENAVLYREAPPALDEIVQVQDTIRRHRIVFEHMWELALTKEATQRLLAAHAAALFSKLDRNPPG